MIAIAPKQNWQDGHLGDYFRIKHGYAFKGEFFSNQGSYILLTPGNFQADGGIKFKGEKEKYYTGDFPLEFLLTKGDLVVVMTDLTQNAPILGSPAFIKEDDKFLHNQRLGKVTELNDRELNKHFLYYLFNSLSVRAQIKASATGATVRHTAPERIYAVKVKVPPLPIQIKIALVLSAYDELIENNQKRIQVLEKSRKLIFQYFVKLGAEDVKRKTLGEISDESGGIIRTGPFGSQLHESDYAQEGVPVVMPKDIINGRVDTNSIAQVPPEVASRLSKHRLDVGDIVYGRRGDIGRRAFISDRQEGWLCGTGCLRISLKGSALHPRFLYAYLGQQEVIEMIAGRAIGATMPNLNTTILRNIPIDVPLYEVQKTFVEQVTPYDNLIENLVARNILLRQTRDLLLPKLISGDLDVEHLNINTEALDE